MTSNWKLTWLITKSMQIRVLLPQFRYICNNGWFRLVVLIDKNKRGDTYKVVSSIQMLRLLKEFDGKHIQSIPSLRLQETVSVGVTWLGRCSETVGTVLTQKCGERLVGIRHKNRKFKCLIYYRRISYSKELVGIYEVRRQQVEQDGDEWAVLKRY